LKKKKKKKKNKKKKKKKKKQGVEWKILTSERGRLGVHGNQGKEEREGGQGR
jgi:hypothetical protein